MQKNVVLYCVESILIPGFQAILANLENFVLSAAYTNLPDLMVGVAEQPPDLILLEVSPEVHLGRLADLRRAAGSTPVVLWVDSSSIEFISQAIALGVRGILPKSLPLRRQADCLLTVAEGGLWVEEALVSSLLESRSVSLTGRERQLTMLLSQGLKNKEMAYTLGITEGTVKVYLSRLYRKLGVGDRFELALYALKHLYPDPATSAEIRTLRHLENGRQEPDFTAFPIQKLVAKALPGGPAM